jgi:hypothetical protein
VPIAEVARFTGQSTRDLMDLVRAGVLEQVPGRCAVQMTAASLRAWMDQRNRLGDVDIIEAADPAADGTIVSLPSAKSDVRQRRQ